MSAASLPPTPPTPPGPTHSGSARPDEPSSKRRGLPLYVQVLLGVVLGLLLGVAFGNRPYAETLLGWVNRFRDPGSPLVAPEALSLGNNHLARLGGLVIDLVKTLALPLIFFGIIDAFVRTQIEKKDGLKLAGICLLNVSVAMALGLALMNLFQPGLAWRGDLETLSQELPSQDDVAAAPAKPITFLDTLKSYIPDSVVGPFLNSNMSAVVVLAILFGVGLRRVQRRQSLSGETSYQTLDRFVEAGYQLTIEMMEMVVAILPYAVFGMVAGVVGEKGLGVFRQVWVFFLTVMAGLSIHAFIYYPLSAWLLGGKSPRLYLGRGMDAIGTGFSTNSSLATVPVTLNCLSRMGVSPTASRLSACVGTNFNNDGITLYEALTALFAAQVANQALGLSQQIGVVIAALMASVGAAGIPGSGLIVLPLVLKAAGIDEEVIVVIVPIVATVDWFLARYRTAVNVLGDMQVAILLDRQWGKK